MTGRETRRHFRAHYLFWPKRFGPKQSNSGQTITIVVSVKIAKNQNGVFSNGFLGWVKMCFYCVFEELCSFENIIFHCVFSKTQQLQ